MRKTMKSLIDGYMGSSAAVAILCMSSFMTSFVHSRHVDVEIRVAIGKSAFIQPDDVNIEPVEHVTSCKIRAVNDDVANVLRVGRIEPQVGLSQL